MESGGAPSPTTKDNLSTPLHFAAGLNKKRKEKRRKEKKKKKEKRKKLSIVLILPLLLSPGVGNLEIVKLLLEKGVNPQAISKEKQTPLALLEQLKPKNYEEIKGILKKGDL